MAPKGSRQINSAAERRAAAILREMHTLEESRSKRSAEREAAAAKPTASTSGPVAPTPTPSKASRDEAGCK
jgi:hypothetical protein